MFTLVVFTLVTMSTVITSVNGVIDDRQAFGGGYDIRATTAPISPIHGSRAAITQQPGLNPADFESTAAAHRSRSRCGRRAPATRVPRLPRPRPRRLVPPRQPVRVRAHGPRLRFGARRVAGARRTTPTSPCRCVRRAAAHATTTAGPARFDFQLSGFYLEDNHLPPLQIDVNDQQTGTIRTLTVIGVLKDTGSILRCLASPPRRRPRRPRTASARSPTTHFVKLAPGRRRRRGREVARVRVSLERHASQHDVIRPRRRHDDAARVHLHPEGLHGPRTDRRRSPHSA